MAILIGWALTNALDFTGSSYLFHRLSADNINAERKRHDAAIEKLQKAQIEWTHKQQQRINFINNQLRLERIAEKVHRVKWCNERISWGIWSWVLRSGVPLGPTTTASRTCTKWFLHPDWWTALQRVGIHSGEYDGNRRSSILSRELNYITSCNIIIFFAVI